MHPDLPPLGANRWEYISCGDRRVECRYGRVLRPPPDRAALIPGPLQLRKLVGRQLAAQRKYAEAEPLLLWVYQGMLLRKTTMPQEGRFALNDGAQTVGVEREYLKATSP